MDELTINRINELYNKAQGEGLTEEEKLEQKKLREEYIASIRNNLKGQLNRVELLNPDGTVTELTKKDIQ